MPAAKKDTTREDEREAPIQVKGLEIPDVPKRVIASAIRDRIERGVYPEGEMLPSLVRLEAMTGGTARGTIRAALKILADDGYLRSVIGMGTTILPRKYWGHPEMVPK
jgi:GntR family transcriptional regulator